MNVKYRKLLLWTALAGGEALLVSKIPMAGDSSKFVAVGKLGISSLCASSRFPGERVWTALQPDQEITAPTEIRVCKTGFLHARLGLSSIILPLGDSEAIIHERQKIELTRGALWVLTSGTETVDVTVGTETFRVAISTQVYFEIPGRMQIISGSVTDGQNHGLAHGGYVRADNGWGGTGFDMLWEQPEPFSSFYFWVNERTKSTFSMPFRGHMTGLKGTSWSLNFESVDGSQSIVYSRSGENFSFDLPMTPGVFRMRVTTETGLMGPWHVVRIVGLHLPQLITPSHKNIVLSSRFNSKLFFLWKGDPEIESYSMTLIVQEGFAPKTKVVSFPQAWISFSRESKEPWTLKGSIVAQHQVAGKSEPVEFELGVRPN